VVSEQLHSRSVDFRFRTSSSDPSSQIADSGHAKVGVIVDLLSFGHVEVREAVSLDPDIVAVVAVVEKVSVVEVQEVHLLELVDNLREGLPSL